jgi:hypothetical protein
MGYYVTTTDPYVQPMSHEVPAQPFYPTPQPQFVGYQPGKTLGDLVCDCVEFLAPVAGIAAVGYGAYRVASAVADSFFSPPPAPIRYRPVNVAPMEAWKPDYVSVRDGWHCVYCGRRVSRSTRHIDHRISRVNGGTNHLNNLSLACASCNLSKGPLNARQFQS